MVPRRYGRTHSPFFPEAALGNEVVLDIIGFAQGQLIPQSAQTQLWLELASRLALAYAYTVGGVDEVLEPTRKMISAACKVETASVRESSLRQHE